MRRFGNSDEGAGIVSALARIEALLEREGFAEPGAGEAVKEGRHAATLGKFR